MPSRFCKALSSCPSFNAAQTNKPQKRPTGRRTRRATAIAAPLSIRATDSHRSRSPVRATPCCAKRLSSCRERQLRRRRGSPPADLPRLGRREGDCPDHERLERGPFPATTIAAAQLVQIIAGQSSLKLFEPLSSGVWILVHGDTVGTFAQQYRP